MFFRLALVVVILFPAAASAHVPVLPQFSTYEDAKTITDPDISRAYYAELSGFPHRYEFSIDASSTDLFVEVLVPDIKQAKDDIDAIIVRKQDTGFVKEVSRLKAADATWESFYEWFGGDTYRRGPGFEAAVEPGEYVLEVHNANNAGKYVLVVGKREDFSEVSTLETMKRIYGVKRFYGKSPIAVLQSPFYLIPTLLILSILAIVWYRRTKYHA